MVHGERSVGLLYGQRALLIGALEPLTYTGTMMSTRSANRPFQRLARTAKIQETILLGTREEADKALAVVQRLHERVKGTLPEAAGVHPAGAAYSAFDPELMLWTLAVIADSGRAMYETMVRPLSEGEREDLWQDYVRFGELFGLPASEVPGSYREFSAWWEERLSSPDLQATAHGLEMAPLVAFEQPVPRAGARQHRRPEPHHQGHPAAAGAGDLRHPLERRPRAQLPGDDRDPPPRPPLLPAQDAPRPQRRLLRRGQQDRAPARRHRDPAAPRRRLSRWPASRRPSARRSAGGRCAAPRT